MLRLKTFSLFESFDYLTFQFKSQEWSGQSVPRVASSPELTGPNLMSDISISPDLTGRVLNHYQRLNHQRFRQKLEQYIFRIH